jgi:hypothetical protein
MRIISKYKDYYDSVGYSHGAQQDKKAAVYLRSEEGFEKFPEFLGGLDIRAKIPYWYSKTYSTWGGWNRSDKNLNRKGEKLAVSPVTFVFCNKLYHALKVEIEVNCIQVETKYFYEYDKFLNYVRERGFEFPDSRLEKVEKEAGWRAPWRNIKDKKTHEFLENQGAEVTNKLRDEMIARKIVCVVIEETDNHRKFYSVIKDPNLSRYNFATIVDPYTAWQEIDMFVSGIASQAENQMATVAEEHRISQHGFDKWSFRRLPEKKK